MAFAEILKDLREEQGITQTLLAAYCKVSTQCISSLEKGTRNPTGTTLLSLANYFNVSVDYLLGRTEDLGAPFPENIQQYTAEEQKLIHDYRGLSRPLKEMLQNLIQTWQGENVNPQRRKI